MITTRDSDLTALLSHALAGQSTPFTLPDGIVVITPPPDPTAAAAAPVAGTSASAGSTSPDASAPVQVDWSVWSQLTNAVFADLEATGTVPT